MVKRYDPDMLTSRSHIHHREKGLKNRSLDEKKQCLKKIRSEKKLYTQILYIFLARKDTARSTVAIRWDQHNKKKVHAGTRILNLLIRSQTQYPIMPHGQDTLRTLVRNSLTSRQKFLTLCSQMLCPKM